MSDPYRIDDPAPAAPAATTTPAGTTRPGSALTITLWTLAAVFAGLNSASSIAGYDLIGAVFGSIGLLFVIIAVARHIARRRG